MGTNKDASLAPPVTKKDASLPDKDASLAPTGTNKDASLPPIKCGKPLSEKRFKRKA